MILTGPKIRELVDAGIYWGGKEREIRIPSLRLDSISTKTIVDSRMNYIEIDPYDPELVGPNSVDLRLGDSLLMYRAGLEQHQEYDEALKNIGEGIDGMGSEALSSTQPRIANKFVASHVLDMKAKVRTSYHVKIPEDGMILWPGILYLGRTVEVIGSSKFVPIVEGRSSVGRLGIHVHVTAGFCDIGFRGTITLEIHVVHPVRIYPNIPICQAYFLRPEGEIELYKGRYQDQVDPTPSRFGIEKKK